jgi:hypothetical protein
VEFSDLTKAFDSVSHDVLITKLEYVLITKLEYYGIVGRTGELIKSYLSNRYQRVVSKSSHASNYISAWELVKHGCAPRVNSWTPIIFILYK